MCEELDLTYSDVHSLLDEVLSTTSYKPGYSFSWKPEGNKIVLMIHTALLPNTVAEGNITVDHWDSFPIEQLQCRESIRICIMCLVHSWERHEIDEWMKFDGVYRTEPHPVVEL